MLGREHHVGRAEQGVGAGGEDGDVAGGRFEHDLRAAGPADPVALHALDLFRPFEQVKVVKQAVGVVRDAHHPLAQALTEDRVVAALGTALGGDLLVGQHGAQARAPVDHGVGEVDEAELVDSLVLLLGGQVAEVAAVLGLASAGHEVAHEVLDRAGLLLLLVEPGVVDLQEDPLRPAIKLRVRGGNGAARVVAQAQHGQLAAHVGNVRLSGRARVGAGLDGVLLCRQTKRVITQCVQHVLAQHAVVARVHIRGDVTQRVADVQPRTRRVGEHVLNVEFVLGQLDLVLRRLRSKITNRVRCVKRVVVTPVRLPLLLDLIGQLGRIAVRGRLSHGYAV